MDRINQIRMNQGHSMQFFSDYIGVDLETYKQTRYKKIRVDIDFLVAVGSKYPADMEYILFGTKGQSYKMINTYISGLDEVRAQFHEEMARYNRTKMDVQKKNDIRILKKKNENYDVDYDTEKGMVETNKRRSSKAAVKTAAKAVGTSRSKKK